MVWFVPVVNFKDSFNFFSPFALKNKDILLIDQEMRYRKGTSQRVMICNDPPTGINSTAAKNNETSILRTYYESDLYESLKKQLVWIGTN